MPNVPYIPLGKNVLIELIEDEKTESGFVVSANQNENKSGKVIAIGDSVISSIKVNDKIWFRTFMQPTTLDGKKYFCLDSDEILAIIEENN